MVPASQGLEGELMVFFDALAGLCAREMAKALQDKDADRASGIIEGLATMLGRSIARSCAGDAAEIDRLLTAVEQHIAAECAGMASVVNLGLMLKKGGTK